MDRSPSGGHPAGAAPGAGLLSVVPTPIGNLEDVTLRALRVLREADVIAAEDTRRTRVLLTAHGIGAGPGKLRSHHAHSAPRETDALLDLVAAGRHVAIVTDAGTPGVSDPGSELIRQAGERGLPIDVLPGASAALTALVASGFVARGFRFAGFLSTKAAARREELAALLASDVPVIFFEAANRLGVLLAELSQEDSEREVFVGRELTKLHQEYARGTVSELLKRFAEEEVRGEVTVVVAPAAPGIETPPDWSKLLPAARARVAQEMERGVARREAVRRVAADLGVTANALYRALLPGAGGEAS